MEGAASPAPLTRAERALLCVAVCIGPWLATPLVIYGANTLNFSIGLVRALPWLSAGALLTGLLCWALLSVSRKMQVRVAALLLALAALSWAQGHLLVWDYGVMDGRPIDWWAQWRKGALDSTAWIVILGAAWVFANRLRPHLGLLAGALVVIHLATMVSALVRLAPPPAFHRYTLDEDHQFDFSSDRNVILLVLDAFQSDVFQEVIEQRPEFIDALDGFTFYRNAAAGFSKTYPSIPLMLTGQWYDNTQPIGDFVAESFEAHSLTVPMVADGWRVDLLPRVPRVVHHSERVASNVEPNGDSVQVAGEAGRLADLSLFRVSPHFLKRFWLNDMEWRLSPWWQGMARSVTGADAAAGVVHRNADARFALGIERLARVHWKQPAFKFYHLMIPHEPFVLREDLDVARWPPGRAGYVGQSATAVSIVVRLVERLKALGVYENSTLVVVADHGGGDYDAGVRTAGVVPAESRDPGLDNIPVQHHASALPLVLVKPSGAVGPMSVSDRPVSIGDVAEILQGAVEGELPLEARGGDDQAASAAPRPYYFYRHQGWSGDYLPPMTAYELRGHAWDAGRWIATGEVLNPPGTSAGSSVYHPGERVGFDNLDTDAWLVSGWAGNRSGGAWTNARQARLRVPVAAATGASRSEPAELRLWLHPFLAKGRLERQSLVLKLAGNALAHWDVDTRGCYTATLPTGVTGPVSGGLLDLTLDLPDAAAPAEFGISNDFRQLGVRLMAFEIGQPGGLRLGESIPLNNEHPAGCDWRARGWSSGAKDVVSIRSRATLALRLHPETRNMKGPLQLELLLRPFLGHGALATQRVQLDVDGTPAGEWVLEQEEALSIALDAAWREDLHLELDFRFPDATSPAQLGMNADERLLGVYLGAITLVSTAHSADLN